MKLIKNVTSIFSKKSKKKSSKKSISKNDPPSFGSSTSSTVTSSSSPRTVLNHKITKEELEDVIRKLGSLQDENIEVIESMVDDVTFEELGSEKYDGFLEEMKDAFGIFDTNGDGKISAEELRGVLVILGEVECGIEECTKMIEGVDSDGDGFVCFDDFVKMMRCDVEFV